MISCQGNFILDEFPRKLGCGSKWRHWRVLVPSQRWLVTLCMTRSIPLHVVMQRLKVAIIEGWFNELKERRHTGKISA